MVDKWLRPLKVVHFDACNLYLEAKDSFHVLWFEEHARLLLKNNFFNNNQKPIEVHIKVQGASFPPKKKNERQKKSSTGDQQNVFNLLIDSLDPTATLDHFVLAPDNLIVQKLISGLTSNSGKNQEIERKQHVAPEPA